ncbi:MAG: hypothetical protein NTV07_07450 [Candidatus Omnitrophica bacterium]|nr:hypothetical protein [Candidatus Omnitrophota bacterium]
MTKRPFYVMIIIITAWSFLFTSNALSFQDLSVLRPVAAKEKKRTRIDVKRRPAWSLPLVEFSSNKELFEEATHGWIDFQDYWNARRTQRKANYDAEQVAFRKLCQYGFLQESIGLAEPKFRLTMLGVMYVTDNLAGNLVSYAYLIKEFLKSHRDYPADEDSYAALWQMAVSHGQQAATAFMDIENMLEKLPAGRRINIADVPDLARVASAIDPELDDPDTVLSNVGRMLEKGYIGRQDVAAFLIPISRELYETHAIAISGIADMFAAPTRPEKARVKEIVELLISRGTPNTGKLIKVAGRLMRHGAKVKDNKGKEVGIEELFLPLLEANSSFDNVVTTDLNQLLVRFKDKGGSINKDRFTDFMEPFIQASGYAAPGMCAALGELFASEARPDAETRWTETDIKKYIYPSVKATEGSTSWRILSLIDFAVLDGVIKKDEINRFLLPLVRMLGKDAPDILSLSGDPGVFILSDRFREFVEAERARQNGLPDNTVIQHGLLLPLLEETLANPDIQGSLRARLEKLKETVPVSEEEIADLIRGLFDNDLLASQKAQIVRKLAKTTNERAHAALRAAGFEPKLNEAALMSILRPVAAIERQAGKKFDAGNALLYRDSAIIITKIKDGYVYYIEQRPDGRYASGSRMRVEVFPVPESVRVVKPDEEVVSADTAMLLTGRSEKREKGPGALTQYFGEAWNRESVKMGAAFVNTIVDKEGRILYFSNVNIQDLEHDPAGRAILERIRRNELFEVNIQFKVIPFELNAAYSIYELIYIEKEVPLKAVQAVAAAAARASAEYERRAAASVREKAKKAAGWFKAGSPESDHGIVFMLMLQKLCANPDVAKLFPAPEQILSSSLLNIGIGSKAVVNAVIMGVSRPNLGTELKEHGADIVGLSPEVESSPALGYISGTAQNIPRSADSFDTAVSIGLFDEDYFDEVIKEGGTSYMQFCDDSAKEIKRVLKDGGIFFASTNSYSLEFVAVFRANGFEVYRIGQSEFAMINRKGAALQTAETARIRQYAMLLTGWAAMAETDRTQFAAGPKWNDDDAMLGKEGVTFTPAAYLYFHDKIMAALNQEDATRKPLYGALDRICLEAALGIAGITEAEDLAFIRSIYGFYDDAPDMLDAKERNAEAFYALSGDKAQHRIAVLKRLSDAYGRIFKRLNETGQGHPWEGHWNSAAPHHTLNFLELREVIQRQKSTQAALSSI